MAGDFNCKHQAWNDHKSNKSGETLAQYISQSTMSIVSPGTPTFECVGGGKSIIDIMLISDNLKDGLTMSTVNYDHPELLTGAPGRGHYPVESCFKIDSKLKEHQKEKEVYDLIVRERELVF